MSPTDGSEINVIDYIKAGQYIKAIKLYREQTGVGLKEAKEHVDNLRYGYDLKVLKCTDIDQMRERIEKMITVNGYQKDFLLDIIDEAYYLGEDSGHSRGYMKSLEENDTNGSDMEAEMDEAYENGWGDGRREGQEEGYEQGVDEGRQQGREEGYDDGFSEGRSQGYDEGKSEGYDEGYERAMDERRT